MQRMISHAAPLPTCQHGHTARHTHDLRRASAGGGHFVECACSASGKHAEFHDALTQWCTQHGRPLPPREEQRQLPLRNVVQLRTAR